MFPDDDDSDIYYGYTSPQPGTATNCGPAIGPSRDMVTLGGRIVGAGNSHSASGSEEFSQNPDAFRPDGSIDFSGDIPFMQQEVINQYNWRVGPVVHLWKDRTVTVSFKFYLLTPSGQLKSRLVEFLVRFQRRTGILGSELVEGWPQNECPQK